MYYLDTCICIEFLRGRLSLGYQHMREEGSDGFRLPTVVVAELYYGAFHSRDPQNDAKLVSAFVSAFEVAPFDARCAEEYGRIRQELASQGNLIGDRDLMIAATALANRAVLVTNNTRDFERIPGLPIESWHEIDLEP